MGTLTFPGLATGIDTTEIVQQLMAIKSRPLANYQVKQMDIERKQSALSELKGLVSQFQSAASALADSDKLQVFSSSSNDRNRLSVSASDQANPGSHSVVINQLASSETWLHDTSSFGDPTDTVGAGTFIYSYNYRERTVTATDSTTLEELAEMINNDEDNPGVTASLLSQGGTYHLMLSGHDTGEDFQISINATSTEVWRPDTAISGHTFTSDGESAGVEEKLTDLDQWSGGHTGAETITITGTDHAGTAILPARTFTVGSGTTLNRLIKEINYSYEGVATARLDNGQIVLTDHNAGTSDMTINLAFAANGSGATLELPTLAVSVEGGSTAASIASLSAASFVQTQNAQNSQIKIDNYTPTATAEVQTLSGDAAATAGTFSLSYGGEATGALAYDASTSAIQTALNGLASIASIGGVTVSGSTLDAGGDVNVQFVSSAGNVDTLVLNNSLVGPTEVTVSETTRGSNEEWISRNANVVSDAITGLSLNLMDVSDTDDDTGDPIGIDITITRNNSAISDKVSTMATSYNTLLETLKSQTEYDEATKRMGILSGNVAVTLMKSQLRLPFTGVATGFSGEDPFDEAADIGLSFDGRGFLKFDSAKLSTALEDNFMGTINLLGAQARGNSDSATVEFNNSSKKYTRPGTYDVQVTVSAGVITSAQIKTQSEGTYRDMTIADNLIIGNNAFSDDGLNPLYPENGLHLQVDLSTDGTFSAKVRVKQGIAGRLNDALDDITKTRGRLDVSNEALSERYTYLDRLIAEEKSRLENHEERLVQKFARLERVLQEMQQQLSAVSVVSASAFRG